MSTTMNTTATNKNKYFNFSLLKEIFYIGLMVYSVASFILCELSFFLWNQHERAGAITLYLFFAAIYTATKFSIISEREERKELIKKGYTIHKGWDF